MDFYGVEIRLCRYYRAQTKGKVESGVKYVRAERSGGPAIPGSGGAQRVPSFVVRECGRPETSRRITSL